MKKKQRISERFGVEPLRQWATEEDRISLSLFLRSVKYAERWEAFDFLRPSLWPVLPFLWPVIFATNTLTFTLFPPPCLLPFIIAALVRRYVSLLIWWFIYSFIRI